MTKMKRITAAILCAILCTVSLCAALIYAESDDTSKFSPRLLEYYETNAEMQIYIHYEDTVDLSQIEAAATEYAEAKVEELRTEGGYTEEELNSKYNNYYDNMYYTGKHTAYRELNDYMQKELGLEDCTKHVDNRACIHGVFSYEEALVIAQNELVISLRLSASLTYDETDEPTDGVGTEDWDDGTVPDETDPEPTTDSTEPTDPTEPPTDAPDLLVGDVDEDGLITATDASNILILAAEMGLGYEPTFEELYAADYNADGNADATDASLILIFAAEEGVK